MDKLLNELGITEKPEKTDDNSYTINITDSNEYGKYFSKLDNSSLVTEEQDASSVSFENSTIQYTYENYTITLLADFENDIYSLNIREN